MVLASLIIYSFQLSYRELLRVDDCGDIMGSQTAKLSSEEREHINNHLVGVGALKCNSSNLSAPLGHTTREVHTAVAVVI